MRRICRDHLGKWGRSGAAERLLADIPPLANIQLECYYRAGLSFRFGLAIVPAALGVKKGVLWQLT